jgi:hypothetical protein
VSMHRLVQRLAARTVAWVSVIMASALLSPALAHAQNIQPNSDPAAALSSALKAACVADQSLFASYLTADNATAFRALPADQRTAFLKRLTLSEQPGKPLMSSDAQNHTVLRCEAPDVTVEFRFGDAKTRENLSFIPVSVGDGPKTEFGMVRESGGWRLISLGLVLLNIPQLSEQWAEAAVTAKEDAAAETLTTLAEAIQKYRSAFGKLPDTLAQLGPAPKDEISPDQASLVDQQLAAGKSDGYNYRYRIAPGPDGNDTNFELTASPGQYGKDGRRSFFLDVSGQIHAADKNGGLASSDDPLMEREK